MERSYMIRRSLLWTGAPAWVFLLFSLGSFRPTDWPSHDVYPYGPIQNLCGAAGASVAYWCFYAIGQGVFPILFFTGVCLSLAIFNNRVSDLWLRVLGLTLLTLAFAAVVHTIR